MQNLIYFFARFGNFILFLLLEIYCVYLIVNYNKTQNAIFINSSNIITGYLYDRSEELSKYYKLSETADSLAHENARLRQKIDILSVETANTNSTPDSLLCMYDYYSAKIIKNSYALRDNILLINKGKKQGIESGMGVFTEKGIIGIVKNTSENFSNVVSILNSQSKISVSILNKGYFGTLSWPGFKANYHEILDLPKHASIEKGDTIITSGYSSIFPEGIIIGKIDGFEIESGSNFYTISVELFEDMTKTKYIYILNNRFKEELKELENLQI